MDIFRNQTQSNWTKRIIIVGGGLVGSLQALFFAQKGYLVDIYEKRDNLRQQLNYSRRSINLTLSERGLAALRVLGIEDFILENAIRSYGRFLHLEDGKICKSLYGRKSECTFTVEREDILKRLIQVGESKPNVNYRFKETFVGADFDRCTAVFQNGHGLHRESGYLIVGCDGAFSSVRKEMMNFTRMDLLQSYIKYGYVEIQLPQTVNGEFALDDSFVHIWSRRKLLLIGLPNKDKTFNLILIMPNKIFNEIKTDQDVMALFRQNFSDILPLIGEENIIKEYRNNPVSSMLNIKCSPYYYKDKVVIMGDAAHAMVPFYAQGLNCGFEDCLKFHEVLEKNEGDILITLKEYSDSRVPDAHAIVDLSMDNFVDLREYLHSPWYVCRNRIDDVLNFFMPNKWIPKYKMTVFTNTPYHQIIVQRKKQDRILFYIVIFSSVTVATVFYKIAVKS